MPLALPSAIRVPATDQHQRNCRQRWKGGVPRSLNRTQMPHLLEHLRHLETQAIRSACAAEIHEAQKEYVQVAERTVPGYPARRRFPAAFPLEYPGEPFPLLRMKPFRIARPVGQIEPTDDAADNRRRAFQNQQPAPARQTEP